MACQAAGVAWCPSRRGFSAVGVAVGRPVRELELALLSRSLSERCTTDFVQDPDVACVQPVDAASTPRDRTLRIRLISQQGDGPTRPGEESLSSLRRRARLRSAISRKTAARLTTRLTHRSGRARHPVHRGLSPLARRLCPPDQIGRADHGAEVVNTHAHSRHRYTRDSVSWPSRAVARWRGRQASFGGR